MILSISSAMGIDTVGKCDKRCLMFVSATILYFFKGAVFLGREGDVGKGLLAYNRAWELLKVIRLK